MEIIIDTDTDEGALMARVLNRALRYARYTNADDVNTLDIATSSCAAKLNKQVSLFIREYDHPYILRNPRLPPVSFDPVLNLAESPRDITNVQTRINQMEGWEGLTYSEKVELINALISPFDASSVLMNELASLKRTVS